MKALSSAAKVMIVPSGDDLTLRCGNCGSMDFLIHVLPLPPSGDYARLTAIVCDRCKKYRKVDEHGVLESIRDQSERESLKGKGNGRH